LILFEINFFFHFNFDPDPAFLLIFFTKKQISNLNFTKQGLIREIVFTGEHEKCENLKPIQIFEC